jgi:Fe-S-cluster containining protein
MDWPYVEGLPAEAVAVITEHREAHEDPAGLPCCWLDLETKRCRWYEHRPTVCRDFEVRSVECQGHRTSRGLEPLPGGDTGLGVVNVSVKKFGTGT